MANLTRTANLLSLLDNRDKAIGDAHRLAIEKAEKEKELPPPMRFKTLHQFTDTYWEKCRDERELWDRFALLAKTLSRPEYRPNYQWETGDDTGTFKNNFKKDSDDWTC